MSKKAPEISNFAEPSPMEQSSLEPEKPQNSVLLNAERTKKLGEYAPKTNEKMRKNENTIKTIPLTSTDTDAQSSPKTNTRNSISPFMGDTENLSADARDVDDKSAQNANSSPGAAHQDAQDLTITLEVPAATSIKAFRDQIIRKSADHLINLASCRGGSLSDRGVTAVLVEAFDLKGQKALKKLFPNWRQANMETNRSLRQVVLVVDTKNIPAQCFFKASLAEFGELANLRIMAGNNILATFTTEDAAHQCLSAKRIFVKARQFKVRMLGEVLGRTSSAWLAHLPLRTTSLDLWRAASALKDVDYCRVYHYSQNGQTICRARVDFSSETSRDSVLGDWLSLFGNQYNWSKTSASQADSNGPPHPPKASVPTISFGTHNSPAKAKSGSYSTVLQQGPKPAPRQVASHDLQALIRQEVQMAVAESIATAVQAAIAALMPELTRAIQQSLSSSTTAAQYAGQQRKRRVPASPSPPPTFTIVQEVGPDPIPAPQPRPASTILVFEHGDSPMSPVAE